MILLASFLKFVVILFVEETIGLWCIEVSKILSLNLELCGIDVKSLAGHREMVPAVAYMFLW